MHVGVDGINDRSPARNDNPYIFDQFLLLLRR